MRKDRLDRAIGRLKPKSKMIQFRLRPEQYEQLLVKVESQKITISKLYQAITDLYLKGKI